MASTINLLRLLADPTRVRLLLLLEQEELSVAELQQILGTDGIHSESALKKLPGCSPANCRKHHAIEPV
jgi:ArsR family transcriptional regulator